MTLKTAPQGVEIPVYGASGRVAYTEHNRVVSVGTGPIRSEHVSQKVELQQRFFVVGTTVLELERNPMLVMDLRQQEFEIVGWSIKLPYGKQDQIGREMIRKFLILFDKAERIEMTESEEGEWAQIVKQVNYRRFCIDRAPARYVEGRLLHCDELAFEIEWVDGSKENVKAPLKNELMILNEGERFGAYARFGAENRLTSISAVKILAPLTDQDGEQLWNEWPTNQS